MEIVGEFQRDKGEKGEGRRLALPLPHLSKQSPSFQRVRDRGILREGSENEASPPNFSNQPILFCIQRDGQSQASLIFDDIFELIIS